MCVLSFIGNNAEAIIALSALGLAVWQGIAQRKHNILSVKPHLILAGHVSDVTPQVQLELRNTGTGPAVIQDFKIYLDEQIVTLADSAWQRVAEQLNINGIWGGGQWFVSGDTIEIGAQEKIFEVKTTKEENDPEHDGDFVRDALNRIQINIWQ